eukprot:CAMPEP_0117748170 /NCGR_PEP_ID=MMETSP0947-20121206/8925_1 /TAXON_ID=44440 /ORGANISM="Chattonella subsalsa, Strain CCMP2191" /LENGTH=193 /DNA_ID=CAMNT_0005565719 /DNA_START=482 /DNA_END=1060 /DNA_ORIENTATION=-
MKKMHVKAEASAVQDWRWHLREFIHTHIRQRKPPWFHQEIILQLLLEAERDATKRDEAPTSHCTENQKSTKEVYQSKKFSLTFKERIVIGLRNAAAYTKCQRRHWKSHRQVAVTTRSERLNEVFDSQHPEDEGESGSKIEMQLKKREETVAQRRERLRQKRLRKVQQRKHEKEDAIIAQNNRQAKLDALEEMS